VTIALALRRVVLALLCVVPLLGVPAAGAATPATVGQPQRGITLWGWTPTAYGEPAALRALDHLAQAGAEWVTLVPMWFQPTATSSALAPSPTVTTSDAALVTLIRAAHARGLKVTVKPQVDVLDGAWRGDIRPADPDRWFSRYAAFLGRYSRLAAREGVEQVVVGTELFGVSGETRRWTRLIAATRARYPGALTYAALPFEYSALGFWHRLDTIGVNAYWELSDRGTTDVAALQRAWAPIVAELAAFSTRHRRPVLLTEAGYASQAGTATKPSSWTLSPRPAPDEQAAAYEALLRSFAAGRGSRACTGGPGGRPTTPSRSTSRRRASRPRRCSGRTGADRHRRGGRGLGHHVEAPLRAHQPEHDGRRLEHGERRQQQHCPT
jgi:hypothetical protein